MCMCVCVCVCVCVRACVCVCVHVCNIPYSLHMYILDIMCTRHTYICTCVHILSVHVGRENTPEIH